MGNAAAVVSADRPIWESWGLDEQHAPDLAQRHFTPAYAVNLPMCPCNGNCGCDTDDRVTASFTPLAELARV